MKKSLMCLVIVGIILVLYFLTGCDYRKMTPDEIAERDKNEAISNHKSYISNLKKHIEVIDWNGHSYVVYHCWNNTYGFGLGVDMVSITHDPDCNCMKE